MESYKHYYVLVSCDVQADGFAFQCWLSTVNAFFDESRVYSHYYDRGVAEDIYHVRGNCELTNKAISMIVEYADKLILEARAKNANRKVSNR